jgi:hypothetical protein
MTEIVTYRSSNAKPNEAWLAYAVLPSGEQWLVRCTGSTEAEARAKAVALYEREQAKYAKHNASFDDCEAMRPKPHGGRGSQFVGKLWMINRATHHLVRINPNQLAEYEANGYQRGGPRSE